MWARGSEAAAGAQGCGPRHGRAERRALRDGDEDGLGLSEARKLAGPPQKPSEAWGTQPATHGAADLGTSQDVGCHPLLDMGLT